MAESGEGWHVLNIVSSRTRILQIGDFAYLARPYESMTAADGTKADLPAGPLTCMQINPPESKNCQAELIQLKAELGSDDAFHSAFLRTIVFTGPASPILFYSLAIGSNLKSWGCTKKKALLPNHRTGPYYYDGHDMMYTVYRIFNDPNYTFVSSVLPCSETGLTQFTQSITPGVVVPPRLYARPEHPRADSAVPLFGLRFSVSEDYDVASVPTFAGNYDYGQYYEEHLSPISKHANIVKRAVELGFRFVGKTHTTSFRIPEHPAENLDTQPPFNPRADGHQLIGDGAAGAIAAYKWLDFNLSVDSVGSMRLAAALNGIFGFRFSTHYFSVGGIAGAWFGIETPAVFVRNVELLPPLVLGLTDHETDLRREPPIHNVEIVILEDCLPAHHTYEWSVFTDFILDLELQTGANIRQINLGDEWRATRPHAQDVNEPDLERMFEMCVTNGRALHSYWIFKEFRETFAKTYGREPDVSDAVKRQWAHGKKIPCADNFDFWLRIATFKMWFNERFITPSTIILLPGASAGPRYRDQPQVRGSVILEFLSTVLGAPEMAIPIAQTPFISRISKITEVMPYTVSMIAGPGQDLVFASWVVALLKGSARTTAVKAGRYAF